MRVPTKAKAVAICLAMAAPSGAAAATFTLIATLNGAPAIGAFDGGALYGILPSGGNGAGSLFKLTLTGAYTDLHDFAAGTDGSTPNARLALATGGIFWGTTQSGGTYGGGTLFSYSAAAGFAVPHAFGNGTDGSLPLQGPADSGGGAVIGTAAGGAIGTNGNLFIYSASGTYTVLHNFLSGADGHCPFSGPTRTPTGALYGTTVGRGFGGDPNGSIWKYAAGTLTTIYQFKDTKDGEWPDQAPVGDAQGNLYGTTHIQGGAAFAGAVWKLSPAGIFTVLHSLKAATNGYQPNSPLILNTDGYLYGTTSSGGSHNLGTVFRISPTGAFLVVHSFTGHSDGGTPTGSLVHDAAGNIYGGTTMGTIFKISE